MKRFVKCCLAALVLGALLLLPTSLAPGLLANPDEETLNGMFVRGDTNNDAKVNLSDAVFLLNYLFVGGDKPPCFEVADLNDDSELDITDAVYVLRFLFAGSSPPPAPFPTCDFDPGQRQCAKSWCNA